MVAEPSRAPAPASLSPDGLREQVGARFRFRFSTGGELTGTLLEIRPVLGAPLLALLADADFFDGGGRCLQHLPYFPLVFGRIESVERAPL